MASLKEVKGRIASVENTKKITEARQMISSAHLHRAQGILENAIKYKHSFAKLMGEIADSEKTIASPLTEKHETGAVAIIIMSSNGGMIGAFNTRMAKELEVIKGLYPNQELLFYPVGKKIRIALRQGGYKTEGDLDYLMDKADFGDIAKVAETFIELYKTKKVKQVSMVYYHLKNIMVQEIVQETILPYSPLSLSKKDALPKSTNNYIMEPSYETITRELLPQMLKAQFYANMMDTRAAEHAARTMAMQLASENADELLDELRLMYNKVRQQNITSELLDIVGSSFA